MRGQRFDVRERHGSDAAFEGEGAVKSRSDLVDALRRMDGRGYKTYKSIGGQYEFGRFVVSIDHVQGDSFAAPSRVSAIVPMGEARLSGELYRTATRRIALEDFLTRAFCRAASMTARGRRGTGKSGMIAMEVPGQAVLERTSVLVGDEFVEARFVMGLPAAGRRVLAREAVEMFDREVPAIIEGSLLAEALSGHDMEHHVDAVEHQEMIADRLDDLGLVAFLADGSVLPRASGIDDLPMTAGQAVAFESPESLRVTIECPPYPAVTGMGVPRGITLIVGGGYHGKSTLLCALERSVYPHIPGDGRERVVCDRASVKIRAEDGRAIRSVDISPFIGDLPSGSDTREFSTENASGSTSQAANIMETLEAGASVLLIDEDTSATNFMIRDERMKALVPDGKEPITPFIDRARALHRERGVSTVLVTGGSGEYLEIADTVIMMDRYVPKDQTVEGKEVAESFRRGGREETGRVR